MSATSGTPDSPAARDDKAVVLADQRVADLDRVAAAELERARELGRKEAQDAIDRAETKARFAAINDSQVETAATLKQVLAQLVDVQAEVKDVKNELKERDAVNAALVAASAAAGAKRLSHWQNVALLVGGLVGVIGVALAVVQALG